LSITHNNLEEKLRELKLGIIGFMKPYFVLNKFNQTIEMIDREPNKKENENFLQ